jgi:hypothetical protein
MYFNYKNQIDIEFLKNVEMAILIEMSLCHLAEIHDGAAY